MSRAADFDTRALREYLSGRLGPERGRFRLDPVAGGQSNPTYFLDHADRRLVLRKKPAGAILPGAHAVEREYRVLKALAPTDVPVPRPVLLCEDDTIIGTPFYLMERVEGRVFSDCALPGLAPAERRDIYLGLADALARLHAVKPGDVGLADFGKPGNYFERQVARWSGQLQESQGAPIPELTRVAAWLDENMPPDDGQVTIAHGDFRLGNMLYHTREPRVIAILDWELSTLGHPLADLGFCCMTWRSTPEEYGGIRGLDLAALGIPTEAEFVARYMSHGVVDAPLRPFHVAFALFRFAVIFVGIADRARAGTAAAQDAERLEPLAGRFAMRALEVIDAAC